MRRTLDHQAIRKEAAIYTTNKQKLKQSMTNVFINIYIAGEVIYIKL